MLQKIDEQNEALSIKRAPAKLKRGDDAKIVFEGDFFKVWHWPQELYDGSIARFESLSRADTVTVLALTKDNKVIMTRQSQPGLSEFLSLPGGIIDDGETVLQASKRELIEETGYASQDWYFLFSGQMNSRIDWANFYLVAKNCELVADKNLDAGEKIEVELFDWEKFPELVKKEEFRQSDFALWWFRGRDSTISNELIVGKSQNS